MTVGIDIVEVKRIEKAIKKWGERFIKRVFLPGEEAYCNAKRNPPVCYSARFAAKEAFSKALGTGIRKLSWKDIEVKRNEMGKPYLIIRGKSKEILGKRRLDISISHTDNIATAIIIIE
ncbi:Holo-[acyl-carrier-protein] synthase [subsurface metagenome]